MMCCQAPNLTIWTVMEPPIASGGAADRVGLYRPVNFPSAFERKLVASVDTLGMLLQLKSSKLPLTF